MRSDAWVRKGEELFIRAVRIFLDQLRLSERDKNKMAKLAQSIPSFSIYYDELSHEHEGTKRLHQIGIEVHKRDWVSEIAP